MDLYLIRHTRPQIEAGVCYGELDVPLPPTCDEDCAKVAARLPSVEAVWTSPLTRCRTLAEAIGRDESERWAADYWNVSPPGGESYSDLYERVCLALAEIIACDAHCIAVVTHAGPIRAALVHGLRLEPKRYPEIKLDYGGINLLRVDGANDTAWRLEYLNG